ncbi:ligand of Numb protein X 2-like isoform X2 [Amphibalanus amphitrite]|uniref:ligand of Numb protein X 2-like isoform X2 n=1 Tax=Amphibalanus amphitrite TaxID=1232801 RepID=UPI001C905C3C|nr:ligand of Numb protein X 2-like isoform X2 [Amphibalanus amphitrite]
MTCQLTWPQTIPWNETRITWQPLWVPPKTTVNVISDGITRLPIIEGEISHIEIPRTATNLGMTIVGGADTPLRCVVIQEVFNDSLVAQDGRLQAGDQIVEVNGVDMTNASHKMICQALKVQTPVLQLGVYREKIDPPPPSDDPELHTVTLEKMPGQTLGIKLVSRRCGSAGDGVYVAEVISGSAASQDSRLRRDDRILYINGRDVRHGRLQLACELIQSNSTVSLVVSRPSPARGPSDDVPDGLFRRAGPGLAVSHARTKSAPERLSQSGGGGSVAVPAAPDEPSGTDEPDRAAISRQARGESMDHLSAPDPPSVAPPPLPAKPGDPRRRSKEARRSLRIEGDVLQQKTVTIAKVAKESLGLRIGGGIHCIEGDTPIYIANINHQGPVGKSKQIKKGDILLSVNGRSLVGLTHAQAVAALKSTAELPGVTLSVLEGPETSRGPAKFIPSWTYWQTLPRCLCYPRGIDLSRSATGSLGFSIVGGCDGGTRDPIHVLFVVQNSPAAVEGRLRCGDRLLAVDGHTLEGVRHAEAVSLLKQARNKVKLQIVSWMGTEV